MNPCAQGLRQSVAAPFPIIGQPSPLGNNTLTGTGRKNIDVLYISVNSRLIPISYLERAQQQFGAALSLIVHCFDTEQLTTLTWCWKTLSSKRVIESKQVGFAKTSAHSSSITRTLPIRYIPLRVHSTTLTGNIVTRVITLVLQGS